MVTFFLLVIIYLAFISLGLPDSILGTAIPAMQLDWNIPLSAGGILSLLITGGTIISSFLSGWVLEKLGTGKVVFISCLMTGSAILGFSLVPGFIWLPIFTLPLGLGAGSVDAALNQYVANHFKAHHMNWLHSFWGVGATAGPLIMGWRMEATGSWQMGYRTIALIQLGLAAVLLISMPLWKRHQVLQETEKELAEEALPTETGGKQKGIVWVMLSMVLYCAVEAGAGLWGSTFLVEIKGAGVEAAASWIALYYGGITLGRFAAGFVSFKSTNVQRIRSGLLIAVVGVGALFLPLSVSFTGIAFVLIGFGFAPFFPAMIHETPVRYGKKASGKIIGNQMGFAYLGMAIFPPLFGVLLQGFGIFLFPLLLAVFLIILLGVSERLRSLFRS